MTRDRTLHVAIAAMAAALSVMLIALLHPTPLTLGAFMGAGLPSGAVGIAAFLTRVVRDLRSRGAI